MYKKEIALSLLYGCIGGLSFQCFFSLEPTLNPVSNILIILSFGLFGYLIYTLKTSPYLISWIFSLSLNTLTYNWIGESFKFKGLHFLAPLGGFLVALIMSPHFPLSIYLARFFGSDQRLNWIITYSIIECFKTLSPFGFPWNPIGVTGTFWLSSVRFIGIYGLSFLILCMSQIFLLPKYLRFIIIGTSLIFFVDNFYYSKKISQPTPIQIRIIQPCIPQEIKWDHNHIIENFEIIKKLTSSNTEKTDIIIWPESAVPFDIIQNIDARIDIANIIPKNTILILGHPSIKEDKAYVSISALNNAGDIIDKYDKRFLVPLGEFDPFKISLSKKILGQFHFSPGLQSKTLILNNVSSTIPLICYESIFTQLSWDKNKSSQWIVNITNEAWFGESNGPYQHFHIARIRAIEQGKPLVRAANNGISGLISPYGQILKFLPLNLRGTLDINLPKRNEETFYNRFHFMPLFIMLFLIWICLNVSRKNK